MEALCSSEMSGCLRTNGVTIQESVLLQFLLTLITEINFAFGDHGNNIKTTQQTLWKTLPCWGQWYLYALELDYNSSPVHCLGSDVQSNVSSLPSDCFLSNHLVVIQLLRLSCLTSMLGAFAKQGAGIWNHIRRICSETNDVNET
jgi:hypothetical protein